VFSQFLRSQALFRWDGYLRWGQLVLLAAAALLFFLGGRFYETKDFLGIKQIQEGSTRNTTNRSRKLKTSGILAITRHPWYLATILLIWARTLDISVILVNMILTAYLIVGTVLEERKLTREFGEKYAEYQQRVSMLFPTKWLTSKIRKSLRDSH
jgi:protein-S-isoprenylcysteine O-methyltransferase Ste14